MADIEAGKIVYKVLANTNEADRSIGDFEKKVEGGGGKFGGLKEIATGALRAIGQEFVALSHKAVDFAKSIVDTGASFEAEMSKVKAISGVTEEEFKSLNDLAQEMGATTKFTATEAGQGLEYMAMAGWKADQMTAGLPAILNLAAAAGEDLGTTSDIVTDALTAFGLQAEDAGHFADILAAASSNANTNVSMMGETFKYAAPVAGALGYEADDLAVAIGLMANSGIKAGQAGTALRGLLSRMAKPTKDVAEAMGELGIKMTDSHGKMKPFDVLMGDMRKKFAGLSEAQKAQYAATLAGQEGMSGLLAIVNTSEEDFEKLTKAVAECDGTAAKMAETMQDNLQGKFTLLSSAMDGFKLALYNGFSEPLKGLTEQVTEWVGDLTEGFQENGISGMIGAAHEIVSGLVNTFIERIPEVLEQGVNAAANFTAGLRSKVGEMFDSGIELLGKVREGILSAVPELLSKVPLIIGDLVSTLFDNLPKLITAAIESVTKLGQTIWENRERILESVRNMLSSVWSAVTSVNWLELGGKIIKGLVDGILMLAGTLLHVFGGLLSDVWNAIINSDWVQAGKNILDGLVKGVLAAPGKLIEAVKGIAKSALGAVKKFFGINSPSRVMRDEVGVMLPRGIAVGVEEDTDEAVKSIDDMNTEILKAATVGVSYDLPDLSNYAQDLGMSMAYRGSAEITVPVILDGREIARGTAYYMGQQMAWEAT